MEKELFTKNVSNITNAYVEHFTDDNETYREELKEIAFDATWAIVDTIRDGAQHIVPLAVRIGLNRTGALSDAEDYLLRESVLNLADWGVISCKQNLELVDCKNCKSKECEAFDAKLENDCRTLVLSDQLYTQLGQAVEMIRNMDDEDIACDLELHLFWIILAFAFAEKIPDDNLIKKLEQIFCGDNSKMNVSNQENRICMYGNAFTVTQLEADIVRWFKKEDMLHPLKRIQKTFANKPKEEVVNALNHLCRMNVLYGGERLLGNSYGLVNADEVKVI